MIQNLGLDRTDKWKIMKVAIKGGKQKYTTPNNTKVTRENPTKDL